MLPPRSHKPFRTPIRRKEAEPVGPTTSGVFRGNPVNALLSALRMDARKEELRLSDYIRQAERALKYHSTGEIERVEASIQKWVSCNIEAAKMLREEWTRTMQCSGDGPETAATFLGDQSIFGSGYGFHAQNEQNEHHLSDTHECDDRFPGEDVVGDVKEPDDMERNTYKWIFSKLGLDIGLLPYNEAEDSFED